MKSTVFISTIRYPLESKRIFGVCSLHNLYLVKPNKRPLINAQSLKPKEQNKRLWCSYKPYGIFLFLEMSMTFAFVVKWSILYWQNYILIIPIAYLIYSVKIKSQNICQS